MIILKLLLYPLALIYNAVMRFRNHLFDIGQKPAFDFERAVIAVGNLNVGGSGKTPMVEYLVELLANRFPTVTLSRGYKRETSGYRVAGMGDNAKSIGDEPLQIFRKYGDRIHVAVGEDRVYAIPHIIMEFPETSVLILDDAFQQRSIRPDLNVLLTSYSRPFYKDFILPLGRLRESRSGARRADVVVVTKCPADLTAEDQQRVRKHVEKYAGVRQVYFSTVEYGSLVPARQGQTLPMRVILVTGIAQAGALVEYCSSRFELLHHFAYADHHQYSLADLNEIEQKCTGVGGSVGIVTTEKDMTKLNCPEFKGFLDRLNWFSLPMKQAFLRDGSKFDAMVIDKVERALQQ